jgi:hypothetical protein
MRGMTKIGMEAWEKNELRKCSVVVPAQLLDFVGAAGILVANGRV